MLPVPVQFELENETLSQRAKILGERTNECKSRWVTEDPGHCGWHKERPKSVIVHINSSIFTDK